MGQQAYWIRELRKLRERTVYTLGPAAGDHDIEWADAQDGTPGDSVPKVTLRGGEARLSGKVILTDTNNAYTLTMVFPPELRPDGKQVIGGLVFYDDNTGTSKGGRFEIAANGQALIKKFDEFAWVDAEELWLSGSWLVAG